MKSAQPVSLTIRQIEFELHKAEHGMAMRARCAVRHMLREARKRKLSDGLRARRGKRDATTSS